MTTQERSEAQTFSNTLIQMLETRRPAKSKSERKFIQRFIAPLGTTVDKRGNHYLRIGNAPVMWSCHTDSVHRLGGEQKLVRVGNTSIGVAKEDASNCLGADDAAGIWLMTEMIKSKVEGLYVFHREEESGRKGSRWIVKNNPTLVSGIKFAIALDRRDKDDIITFQSGLRCCSDEFAASLAAQLDLGYKASQYGSFTDTASYTDLVPECTNLSVGYRFAHSSSEEQDAMFLLQLRDRLLKLNIGQLVEKRKAGEVEEKKYQYADYSSYGGYAEDWYGGSYRAGQPYAGSFGWWDAAGGFHPYNERKPYSYEAKREPPTPQAGALKHEEMVATRKKWWERVFAKANANKPATTSTTVVKYRYTNNGRNVRTIREDLETTAAHDEAFANGHLKGLTLERLVRNHPEEIADYLEQYGVGVDELSQHILTTTGILRCH